MIKKGLGKGLEALIPNISQSGNEILEIKINDIEPNTNQPRKNFDEEELKNLAESIRSHGVIQPIIVTQKNGRYQIIAGERRWRAARLAGLKTVPAIVKDFADKKALEVALIENIQRQDLNPIEEAEAFQKLIQDYNMTQEEIAATIGKSRSAVANSLRLLALDEEVKKMVIEGRITAGHARALVSIEDKRKQVSVALELEKRKLNVRETENFVKKVCLEKEYQKKENSLKQIESEISEKLKNILGTKVELISGKERGKIIIEYYSNEELDRILDLLYSLEENTGVGN